MIAAWLLSLAMVLQAGPPGLRTIARTQMSRVEEARQMVARTETDWTALWRAHAGDTPAPKVDFGASTVAAVFLGERMSGGFSVEITGTRLQGHALVVEWSETRPGREMVTSQIITSPAHLVAIPRFAGEIRFGKVDR